MIRRAHAPRRRSREGGLRSAFFVSALLGLASCGGASAPPLSEPANWDAFGEEARGRLRKAVAACRGAPADPALRARLGRLYHGVGAAELALRAYEDASRLGGADAKSEHLRGLLLAESGRTSEAAAAFLAAAAKEPNAPWPRRERARALLDAGDATAALPDARAAHRLSPDDASARLVLARALRESGDLAGALALMEAAPAAARNDPHARQYRAVLLRASGRADEAEAESARAPTVRAEIRDDPWFAEVQATASSSDDVLPRAEALIAAGRIPSAIRLLESAVKSAPRNGAAWRKLGEARMRSGDSSGAVVAFRTLLEVEPGAPKARTMIASLLLDGGDVAGAAAEAAVATLDDPGDVDASLVLGAAELRLGRALDAEARLRQVVGTAPDRVLGWTSLGRARLALGRFGEAAAAFERALAIHPNLKDATDGLAEARRRMAEGR